ncbi:haloacid dehalogenase [Geothrix limicola]|uniref:Haloacid dehalogenase n=1 Tax=Geothrix limicola TaxID=2927978 RepID=A0ABQ5QJ99_9BACT|nr:HAD-IG family 5'-nucleotidase [Geothrix limicola]GLH74768.1 haloacid dehalogenase [Geothrix limicola]
MTAWDPALLAVPPLTEAEERLPPAHKLYALRTLPMGEIKAMGFDMDHTLARYKTPEIDELAFKKAARLLVRDRGYSPWLLEIPYDPAFAVRGLVLDGLRGNLLKLNRERQVVRASHGSRALTRHEVDAIYSRRRLSTAAKGFRSIDTLFEIPESFLYAQMVDGLDRGTLRAENYLELFQDVRWAIDTAHRNGEMKAEILAHRDFFIQKEPLLALALDRLKRSGKKLFLLTNSEWSFTDGVLSHLLNGQDEARPNWTDYFDLIVVSSRKPAFFLDAPEPKPLEGHPHCYSGGHTAWLESLLDARGEEVLYVGDHIYGDVLRSKKNASWRTLLLVPELERELQLLEAKAEDLREVFRLETARRRTQRKESVLLDQWRRNRARRHILGQRLSSDATLALDHEAAHLATSAEALQRRADLQGLELKGLMGAVESAFNPMWGPMFRDRDELTRFADQIQQFACAYTGKVGNLYMYDPLATLYGPRPALPHERRT